MTANARTAPVSLRSSSPPVAKTMLNANSADGRRAELEAELDSLRRARGKALVEGEPFDATSMRVVEDALQGLEDASAEMRRRDAAAAAAADAERKANARALIAEKNSIRHAALGLAETAARQMVVEMQRYIDATAEISKLAVAAGGTPPLGLARTDTETRLSRYLAALLVRPPLWQFGVLEWNSLPPAPADWNEAEGAISAAIEALTKETP